MTEEDAALGGQVKFLRLVSLLLIRVWKHTVLCFSSINNSRGKEAHDTNVHAN